MNDTKLYAAKDESGVTRGYVHAESPEQAREYFTDSQEMAFADVVAADHVGPHVPGPGGCRAGCVS